MMVYQRHARCHILLQTGSNAPLIYIYVLKSFLGRHSCHSLLKEATRNVIQSLHQGQLTLLHEGASAASVSGSGLAWTQQTVTSSVRWCNPSWWSSASSPRKFLSFCLMLLLCGTQSPRQEVAMELTVHDKACGCHCCTSASPESPWDSALCTTSILHA